MSTQHINNGTFNGGVLAPWTVWEPSSGPLTAQATGGVTGGCASFAWTTLTERWSSARQNLIPVTGGSSTTYSYAVRTATPRPRVTTTILNLVGGNTIIDFPVADDTYNFFSHTRVFSTGGSAPFFLLVGQDPPNEGGQIFMDDISVFTPAVCISGRTQIRVKESNDKISTIPASQVTKEHRVFDTQRKEYVKVLMNIETGPTKKIVRIPAGSLGKSSPSEDLFLTTGHRVLYRGVETKARDLPGAVYVGVPEKVYTFVCEHRCPIWANGADVMVYDEKEWSAYQNKIVGSVSETPAPQKCNPVKAAKLIRFRQGASA